MPRGRKKINLGPSAKPPKVVLVSFYKEATASFHVLNLPEKLNPPLPVNGWQPSALDSLLSQPLKQIIPAKNKPALILPKIQLPSFHLNFTPKKLLVFLSEKQKNKTHRWKIPQISLPQWNVFKTKKRQNQKQAVGLKIKYAPVPSTSFFVPAWHRALASFVVVAIILILPFKVFSAYYTLKGTQTNLISSGTEAFTHLNLGKDYLEKGNLVGATDELQQSLNIFTKAQNELNNINPIWRSLLSATPVIGEKIKNGERLILAGSNLTLAGLPLVYLFNNQDSEISLLKIKSTLEEIIPRIQDTNRYLMAIDPNFIPQDKRDDFQKVRQTIFLLSSDLQKIQSLVKNLDNLLGADESKTYLIVFQNNNEMRPTGGFIGSYAELKIDNGKITKFDIPGEGSYKLQGSLKIAVLSPAPLQILKSKWEFQDANWFADFPTSAKKIDWFYEKSGGPTIDGVIALDTSVLTDLLPLAGPLDLPQYNKTLTSENAVSEIQKQVEVDYDKTQNQPKQILSDLAPLLLNKLTTNKTDLLPLLTILNRNLNEKHIQIFLKDPSLEKDILSQGWGGEMKDNPKGDFLMVVNSNVGADKTDEVITQTINHDTKIENDGSIIDTVTVKRTHNGPDSNPYTNRQNVDYIRFYVPFGSQLLEAKSFGWPEEKHFKIPEKWYKIDDDLNKIQQNQTIDERNGTIITQEFDKTVFGNWILTKPGQQSEITLTYRLPLRLVPPPISNWQAWLQKMFKEKQNLLSYSLLVQKQPGTTADQFSQHTIWPEFWKPLWTDPDNLAWQDNELSYQTDLKEDRFLGLIFENQN